MKEFKIIEGKANRLSPTGKTPSCRSCPQKPMCKSYIALAGREAMEIERTIKFLNKSDS